MSKRAPNFWMVFADAIGLSAEQRGVLAYFPWLFLLCTVGSVSLVHFYFDGLLVVKDDSSLIGALAAIAVIGAFFGSVSVALMAQIQNVVCEYPFSDYLKEEKLFDIYLFWPQFTLLLQLAGIMLAGFSSYFVFLGFCNDYRDEILVLNATYQIYIFTKTWGLVDLMRIVAWHKEQYDSLLHRDTRQ